MPLNELIFTRPDPAFSKWVFCHWFQWQPEQS